MLQPRWRHCVRLRLCLHAHTSNVSRVLCSEFNLPLAQALFNRIRNTLHRDRFTIANFSEFCHRNWPLAVATCGKWLCRRCEDRLAHTICIISFHSFGQDRLSVSALRLFEFFFRKAHRRGWTREPATLSALRTSDALSHRGTINSATAS